MVFQREFSSFKDLFVHGLPRQRPIQVLVVVVLLATFTTWLVIRDRDSKARVFPLNECHAEFLANASTAGYDVVRFGDARVAIPPGEQLGEALWACTEVGEVLQRDCPSCDFVELGGPGLCAFSTARRFQSVRVVLHPGAGPAKYAEGGTAAATGKQHQPPSYTALAKISTQLNNLSKPVCIDCTIDNSTVAEGAVALVRLCPGCSSITQEPVVQLLQLRALRALILLLPADAHADARRAAAAMIESAVESSLKVFQGGFDGPAVGDPAALLSAASNRTISLYLAQSPRPPPTLHVFTGLHVQARKTQTGMVSMMCRYLLDTAAAHNLTVHVVGLAVSDSDLGNPTIPALKLASLRHALRHPSVRPTDVVMLVDATDTLAQSSSAGVLQRYMAAGAPVFEVATEGNCWPEPFRQWCDRLGNLHGDLPNKWLNGGGFVARAAVAAKYVEDGVDLLMSGAVSNSSWMPRSCACLPPDDQGMVSCAYLLGNRYGMTPDLRSSFFFSIFRSSQHLEQGANHWTHKLTATVPAIVHGNGWEGKERLESLRAAIVPAEYSAEPGSRLILDGTWVAYSQLCNGTSQPPKHAVSGD